MNFLLYRCNVSLGHLYYCCAEALQHKDRILACTSLLSLFAESFMMQSIEGSAKEYARRLR